jgi:hypothetical protein
MGCKTNSRQFERCIKYTKRGWYYDIVDKYISIINDILSKDKVFVTERITVLWWNSKMKVALGIISIWRGHKKLLKKQLDILKSII